MVKYLRCHRYWGWFNNTITFFQVNSKLLYTNHVTIACMQFEKRGVKHLGSALTVSILPLKYRSQMSNLSIFQIVCMTSHKYTGDLNIDHLNTRNIWITNLLDFKWFGIQMVRLWIMSYVLDPPFKYYVPVRLSSGWAVWYSNGIWKPDHLASNLFLTIWIPD